MYGCHSWTSVTGPTTGVTLTATFVTSVLLTGNTLGQTYMQWNNLVTIDNQWIRLQQIHNYPNYFYP